jgi:hypothetical protein
MQCIASFCFCSSFNIAHTNADSCLRVGAAAAAGVHSHGTDMRASKYGNSGWS